MDLPRQVLDGMIDRRPGLVVRAASTADIRAAVDFARDNGLLIAVRSGGHQIGGLAVAGSAACRREPELQPKHGGSRRRQPGP